MGSIEAAGSTGPGVIAASETMQAVLRQCRHIAVTRYPVALIGPTGVGKGLLAQAMHAMSGSARGPFHIVGGGELTPSLLQSELYGHEEGAFTGAKGRRRGHFELAAGGTIFLDEMHLWKPRVQAAMLRALGERAVIPLGAARSLPLTCRFIFAANQPLDDLVNAGILVKDLRHRIGEFEIRVPGLAERPGDIMPLAYAHLARVASENGYSPGLRLEPQVAWQLIWYAWPGNVRELHNVITHAAVSSGGEPVIRLHHLPARLQRPLVQFDALDKSVRREMVGWAYRFAHGSRLAAADLVGVHPHTIDYHVRRHGAGARVPGADAC